MQKGIYLLHHSMSLKTFSLSTPRIAKCTNYHKTIELDSTLSMSPNCYDIVHG